jgi:hypothetical protein
MKKLTWAKVNAMRASCPTMSIADIADQHGIAYAHCYVIIQGFSWKDRSYRPQERRRQARLDWPSVRAIRAAVAAGERQNALARHYGVSPTAICLVIKGKNWPDPTYSRSNHQLETF